MLNFSLAPGGEQIYDYAMNSAPRTQKTRPRAAGKQKTSLYFGPQSRSRNSGSGNGSGFAQNGSSTGNSTNSRFIDDDPMNITSDRGDNDHGDFCRNDSTRLSTKGSYNHRRSSMGSNNSYSLSRASTCDQTPYPSRNNPSFNSSGFTEGGTIPDLHTGSSSSSSDTGTGRSYNGNRQSNAGNSGSSGAGHGGNGGGYLFSVKDPRMKDSYSDRYSRNNGSDRPVSGGGNTGQHILLYSNDEHPSGNNNGSTSYEGYSSLNQEQDDDGGGTSRRINRTVTFADDNMDTDVDYDINHNENHYIGSSGPSTAAADCWSNSDIGLGNGVDYENYHGSIPNPYLRTQFVSNRQPLQLHPVYSDRFIPSRMATDTESGLILMGETRNLPNSTGNNANGSNSNNNSNNQSGNEENSKLYHQLLKTELLGIPSSSSTTCPGGNQGNLFKYKSAPRLRNDSAFSLLPVPFTSESSTTGNGLGYKSTRKIGKVPCKVLDAPQLQDDFYLNLVDWSSSNCLSVGLSNCVYLWSACTSRVTKLCDLGADDLVTSVSWTQRGTHLAVGTNRGEVQIWDVGQCRKLRTMTGHRARVGTMSWSGYVLSTGSRDHYILHRDVREQSHYMARLCGHKQEVCGLKWSFDETQLASGGNDNRLFIWNLRSATPVLKFSNHVAAVKALAWSPHQHGLLSSGGGTADRCIRFWNTINNTNLSCIDTGSQVCNLSWSQNVNELVSTHGYSLNQIIVWKYPSMSKVVTLTGHTYRVLYLALSPDGKTIVTGAGDETLRFWNVFPGSKSSGGNGLALTTLPVGATMR